MRPRVRQRRDHLSQDEIDRLIAAARALGRHGHRHATMIHLAYRHGFRVTELVQLKKDQVDLDRKILYVRRLKRGMPATHTLHGTEVRELRRVLRESPDPRSPYVFVSERGGPLTRRGFAAMLQRAGEAAGLPLRVFPHMLRHTCGHLLANRGEDTRRIQEFLGHTNIAMTVKYTALAEDRLKDIWGD